MRKISFGTRSERGSRFIERIPTVVTTLKQQEHNLLEFLTAALSLPLQPAPPSLLPVSASVQAASVAA